MEDSCGHAAGIKHSCAGRRQFDSNLLCKMKAYECKCNCKPGAQQAISLMHHINVMQTCDLT